jgi:SAM-dependent methyltransferase
MRPSRIILNAKQTRKRIGAAASKRFWSRYALFAPYLGLRSTLSTFTGKTTSGATHASKSVDAALAYIETAYCDYKRLAGINHFAGKVAEIGPGDSCGVGLLFLADGCEQVDLIDRFYTPRDISLQQEINRRLASESPELLSRLLDDSFSDSSFQGLTRYYGQQAAAETFFRDRSGYSAVVSRAVVEHLYDPIMALALAIRALAPGGVMVHAVDCRDHLLFSEHFHELKFLELPQLLYSPFRWNGGPNRVRLSAYIDLMTRERMEHSIYITRLAGIDRDLPLIPLEGISRDLLGQSLSFVSGVRSRLSKQFRQMSDQDLMVQGFFLAARKPLLY